MEKLKSKYSIIGDVRGKGLMIGLELIKNDEFASPVENEKYFQVWEACRDLGLIIGRGGIHGNVIWNITLTIKKIILFFKVLRIKPPMCITKEDAKFTIEVLDRVFEKIKWKQIKYSDMLQMVIDTKQINW